MTDEAPDPTQDKEDKVPLNTDLFQRKVVVIGELHTQRALWANMLGDLKSEILTQQKERSQAFKDAVGKLDEQLSELSQRITDFKPNSIEELEAFAEEMRGVFSDMTLTYERDVRDQS
ncbi:MAG: hypothetical protein ACFE0O_00400 [Opitutales bacterium]